MSASSTSLHRHETYDRLVNIICPDWSKRRPTPALLEVAILPSSSHPDIQYDPMSSPPAVGIPKSLGLACFLNARSIVSAQIKAISARSIEADSSYHIPLAERTQILESTAVMLVWEPNHLTAINWRRRVLQQLLQSASASEHIDLGESVRRAELIFLESLLTSPMSQHAKSSMLWAYRLQLLRASEEYHRRVPNVNSPERVEKVLRMELDIVMKAGERHPKNYYAWEYARQASLLISDSDKSNGLREFLPTIHQWCLMHPADISGWSFLASWLQRVPNRAVNGQDASEILVKTRNLAKKFDWKGESVNWFLRTMEGTNIST